MEHAIFQLFLVLFGFFLGGVFPVCLSDCGWSQKLLCLILAVHISENYWLQKVFFIFKLILLSIEKKVSFTTICKKNKFLYKLLINFFTFIEDCKLQFQTFIEYLKIGFFFGIFVDALKVGS